MKSVNSLRFLLCVAALFVITATAYTSFTTIQYATKNCTGQPVSTTTVPLNQCSNRTTHTVDLTCGPVTATCVDVEWFSGLTCTPQTLHSTYTYECEACYADFDVNAFFTIRDCHNDGKRALHYGCDSTCKNCDGSMVVPMNGCEFVIVELMSLRPIRVRPCPVMMLEKSYPSPNCSSELYYPWSTPTHTCVDEDTASYMNTCN